MALVLTPVTIDQVAASSGVATSTHSFSPASGAMVAVAVTWLPFSNSSMTITCADSHGNSYTAGPHASDTGPVSTAAVFTFTYGSAPGSTTLTVTSTDTASADVQIAPVVITGQASSQAGAATLSANGSSTAINGSITPTVFGSFVIGAVGMGSTTAISAVAGCTSLGTWNDANSGDTAGAFATSAITIAPTIAATVGFTCASSHLFCIAALEILPAITQPWPLQAVSLTNTATPMNLTLPFNATAGNTLVACVTTSASPTNPTVSSITLGGSADHWAQGITPIGTAGGSDEMIFAWVDPNCAGGSAAVSITLSASAGSNVATVFEVPGIATSSPVDVQTGTNNDSTGLNSWSSGTSGTTSQASELAVGFIGSFKSTGVGTLVGPAAPWANMPQTTSASTHVGLVVGFQPLTATGTVVYSGTSSAVDGYCAAVFTLKAAGGAGAQPSFPKILPGPTWLDLFKPGLPRARPYLPQYTETEQGALNVVLPVPVISSFSGTNINPSDMPMILPGPAWLDTFKPGMRKPRPQQPVYPYRTAGEQGNLNIVLPVPLIGPLTGTNVNPSDMPAILPGPAWLDLFKPGWPRPRPPAPPDPGVKVVLAPLTVVLPTLVTSLSGSRLRQPENLGAVLTLPSPNGNTVEVVESATATLLDYRATLVLPTFSATLVGWTMLTAPLTLSEFNDVTIDIAITQNGSPYNLAGVTVNLLFKTAAGTPDANALIFSSGGGSPAITITNSAGGLAVAVIPNTDLDAETYFFYRLDVVNAGLTNTTLYGPITWISL